MTNEEQLMELINHETELLGGLDTHLQEFTTKLTETTNVLKDHDSRVEQKLDLIASSLALLASELKVKNEKN